MGREEQIEERDVLSSIFPDEITDVSDTAYRISIALEVEDPQRRGEEEDDKPSMVLQVSYPSAYPDVGPDLDLSNDMDGPRHPLLDIAEDKTKLLEALNPTIEENLGMAMVFTLVTTLKEAAEALIIDRQTQAQEVKEVEARKVEEEENKKFHGTPVNRATFMDWRTKFKAEMEDQERLVKEEADAEAKKGVRTKVEEKKLTGRQLWERGLIGKVEEDDAEFVSEVALPASVKNLEMGG